VRLVLIHARQVGDLGDGQKFSGTGVRLDSSPMVLIVLARRNGRAFI
jgi:hypothetical protein